METISFSCNACGKCCNTPPAMTVDELFRHERLFVGCLAISRVRRCSVGSRIPSADTFELLDDPDAAHYSALQDELLYDADPSRRSEYVYSLRTQGLDYASLNRCPALADDGRCSVHDDGKPGMCEVVPLDPYVPDRLQASVLRNRMMTGGYFGARCITPGEHEAYQPLVRHRKVVNLQFSGTLATQRKMLAKEKVRWGQGVFSLLKKELIGNPTQRQRIPVDGYLSLPLLPVLIVLLGSGEISRGRCIQYMEHQTAVIDSLVANAIRRKDANDRATTTQLRGFIDSYTRQRNLFLTKQQ
jgi:Fe-S-cluster containining protein